MLMPAILLVAVLGSSAQDAPAPAPSPKTHRKVAKPAARKTAPPTASPAEPATEPAAQAATASPASSGDDIQAGLNAFAKGRFATARAAFERAVAADPQSAAAHFYLGYTIYKIAEPKRHDSPGKKEAAAEFAKAYELDPNFKPVWGSHKG